MSGSLPRQWLDRAREDVTVARLVLGEGHTAHACFLSQQCIEKALKAYLHFSANQYPRTHSLVDLLQQCINLNQAFDQFRTDCTVVDQYYVATRYPDSVPGGMSSGVPTMIEANEAIEAAKRLFHFVIPQIP